MNDADMVKQCRSREMEQFMYAILWAWKSMRLRTEIPFL